MKNSMKRMLSAVMAITMVAGATSATAFAEDFDNITGANGADFTATNAEITMPVISVSVPTESNIVIDPFNTKQGGQIDSTVAKIVNNSNVPMSVTLKGISATTQAETFALVAKAPTDGSKWAIVSAAVTDGTNKTTSKVLSAEGQDIAVSTAMAPMGGIVSFKMTGTCATAITKDGATDWTEDDKITVVTAYQFAPQTFATYEVIKAPVFWDKAQATEVTLPTVAEGDDAPTLADYLPATISNGGKELPVTWHKDNAEDASALTADAEAGVYTAKVADEDIYIVADGVTLPTITIKAAS